MRRAIALARPVLLAALLACGASAGGGGGPAGGGSGGDTSGSGYVFVYPFTYTHAAYDFGDVRLGSSAPGVLMLQSGAAIPPDPATLAFAGAPDAFGLRGGSYPGVGGTCGPQVIGPACRIVLEFAPADEQARTAQVQLGGKTYGTLSGRGVSADGPLQLVAPATVHDFGPVPHGARADVSFTFRNAGSAAVTPVLLAPSGAQLGGWQIHDMAYFWVERSGSTCLTAAPIAPGDTCTVAFSFQPQLGPGDWGLTVRVGDGTGAPVPLLLLGSSL